MNKRVPIPLGSLLRQQNQCPDDCCSVQEIQQGSVELLPSWCVSRPGVFLEVLMGWTVLQQVLHCHWRCAAGAHCRVTEMGLGEHVVSESAGAVRSLSVVS